MLSPPPLDMLTTVQRRKVLKACAEYTGPSTRLSGAIGALVMGRMFGWRALRMMHNPATIRLYESVLGVDFKKDCPAETTLSKRSKGYRAWKDTGAYWDVVMGRRKVERKGDIDDGQERLAL